MENNEESQHGWDVPPDARFCGRVKYHFPKRGGLTFDETIFDANNDIVTTNEYFGSGALAFRLPIFSKRIKTIIEREKLRGISFTPIFHKSILS
jgi:hypothetical protein